MNTPAKLIQTLVAAGVMVCMCAEAWADEVSSRSASNIECERQHVLDGWALGVAFSIIAMGRNGPIEDTLRGPSVYIALLNPGGIGFDFGVTYLEPTGFHNFTGLSADAALSYGFPITRSTMFLLRGGVVGYVGGNSDGGGGGDVAIYPGIGVVQRLVGPLAASAEVAERFWLAYDGWQSFGARLGLLLTL